MTTPEGAKGWVDQAGSAQVLAGGHGLDVAPNASPDGVRAETRREEDGTGGEPSNAPNAALTGEHQVHVLTTLSRSGCQAVEVHLELGDPGPATWRLCGLPPFATTYCGWFDKDTGDDVEPVLCWRHLSALGDTRDIVVRPVAS